MRNIITFSCTRGAKDGTALYRSLRALGMNEFVFAENNREGLATLYNRFLDDHAAADALAVFAHDDVSIEDVFVREKLTIGADRFVVQGLAGAASFDVQSRFPQTVWVRAPRQHLSGAVEHPASDGGTGWTSYGPTPRPCIVLDGLFLAVDLQRIGSVRFDEQFPFHFYDLDFCLAVHRASLPLGTVNVHAHHRSGGDFTSPAFFEAQGRFRDKWRNYAGSLG